MSFKVLVVDDMKSFLDLETSFLKRTDCAVLKAVNGLEAIRLAKESSPDIIFLDLEMPVMNGLECCRFIRSDINLKSTPIVIVTASSKEEECFKAGCSSYLRKPVDEDIFLSEIKKYLPIKERADDRLDFSSPVNVNYKGTVTPATIHNISKSGVLIESPEPFSVGTLLTVDFALPGAKSKVKTKAMIVRAVTTQASNSGRFGLRFFEIEEKHQSAIDSFIESRIKEILS